MRARKHWLFFPVLAGIAVFFMGYFLVMRTEAGSIYDSPYVTFSPDGKAWTIDRPLWEGTGHGAYNFWYSTGDSFRTGIASALPTPGEGEHYYDYQRVDHIPVGEWRVEFLYSRCIQGKDIWDFGTLYHGIAYGQKRCMKPYYSGWIAYCADCGRAVDVLVYMSKEAALSITELDTRLEYYYLCPNDNCRHLEQGAGIEAHYCRAVSCNKYRVVYQGNGSEEHYVDGAMAPSYHMYNNSNIYEGNPVTPVRCLTRNSYTRKGYQFSGWNTEPDGSGDFYEDGAEVWNLTDENFSLTSPETGTVTLYAQWVKVTSSLIFDPGEGSYSGENPVVRGYGSKYVIDQSSDKVTPPAGCTVSFHTNGGAPVAPITARRSFLRWDIQAKICGRLEGDEYQFLGDEGDTDRLVAAYSLESITLPTPVKGNTSFGGWFLDAELTQPAGAGGDAFTPDHNCTLYARWVELKLKSVNNDTTNQGRGAVDLFWSQPDGANKSYRLYQSADGGKSFSQITSVTESATADETFELTVEKPGESRVVIPSSGFYQLAANGAQGGGCEAHPGGRGGSVSGRFYLKQGEILTVTAGGCDGTNGGGDATDFGNGGGMTKITSNLKGTLLIGGGGGGATPYGKGQDGGIGNQLVDAGEKGGSGMAGGGGGLLGGAAGEHVIHTHEPSCLVRTQTKASEELYSDITSSVSNIYAVSQNWGDAYVQYDGRVRGMPNGSAWYSFQLGGPDQYFAVSGEGTLAMDARYSHWGSETVEYQGTEVLIMDASSNEVAASYFLEKDFKMGAVVSEEVSCRVDEGRNRLYYADVHTRNYADEFFEGLGVFKMSRYHQHLDGGHHGILVTAEQSGTLSFQIPKEVEKVYVICRVRYGMAWNCQDGVWSSMRLSNLRYTSSIYECGYEEGQVVSSRPGYGGSSYVNTAYAAAHSSAAGARAGDGSAQIKADGVGMTEGQELRGVAAPDTKAPDAVKLESVRKEAAGESAVLVTFEPVEDRGTEYYFKAESCSVLTGQLLCTSNITKNLLATGVKGYLYLVDTYAATSVTASNAANKEAPKEETCITVELAPYTQYLHIAAVDGAGNLSATTHVEIKSDEPVAWELSTKQAQISSVVGGRDYGNVHPAGTDRAYYVRADGATPFLLSFDSVLHGMAREDYQINWQIFWVKASGQSQQYMTKIPYTTPLSSVDPLDASGFMRQSEGGILLRDALYTGASRGNQGADVSFYQAFTLDDSFHGAQITVMPTAGASFEDTVQYSDMEKDRAHALTLIGDSRPPVIIGLEAFQTVKLIDRNQGSIVLELTAEDDLSGVGEFYLEIVNEDNYCREKYLPGPDGVIRVEITEDEPIFSGDFFVKGYAADRVGNVAAEEWYVTEFALNAKVSRILSPHEPAFKRGESGMLDITAWGYADRVEVEFPEFLSAYNADFVYAMDPEYKKQHWLQFMIPLDAPEGGSYEITVRAYKGDKRLEEHPSIKTIEIDGTILDELRTRLR